MLGSASNFYVVELGTIVGNPIHSRSVILTNTMDTVVKVDSFSASCECTFVVGPPLDVSASGSDAFTVTTNLTKEPDFSAAFGIAIELKSGEHAAGTIEVRRDIAKQEAKLGPCNN